MSVPALLNVSLVLALCHVRVCIVYTSVDCVCINASQLFPFLYDFFLRSLVARQTAKICSFETFFTFLCGTYTYFFENGEVGTKEPEKERIVLEFKQ